MLFRSRTELKTVGIYMGFEVLTAQKGLAMSMRRCLYVGISSWFLQFNSACIPRVALILYTVTEQLQHKCLSIPIESYMFIH